MACDEPGDAQHALRPDNDAGNSHDDGRKNALWGTLMAGGWGNEWYFGYAHAHSDLTLEDFRSRDAWWDYARYALEFFNDNDIPFWEMHNEQRNQLRHQRLRLRTSRARCTSSTSRTAVLRISTSPERPARSMCNGSIHATAARYRTAR